MSQFKKRREKLAEMVKGGALILTAHPEQIRNNDVHHAYRQDSSFFYLTGFEEPESFFVFRPGKNPESVLFVREKNLERETWDGFRYGPDAAKSEFQMDACYKMSEFSKKIIELLSEVDCLYYRFYNHGAYDKKIKAALLGVKNRIRRSGKGFLPVHDALEVVGEMRLFKSEYEHGEMKKAAEIAGRAHIDVMKAIRPGISERALHGIFLKSIYEQGCAREAYGGIFASGNNATTLHYVFNDQICKDGEMFLVDAGGEYNYYASDITRAYPVNKKFNSAQKKIYQKVLDLQKQLLEDVKPGIAVNTLQQTTLKGLTAIMIEEGLLKGSLEECLKDQLYLKYYPHGVSHWLGMDVHDSGLTTMNGEPRRIEPGMVFTVEPGIYIPADDKFAPKELRGIGIRIEDDVYVTQDGCDVMTSSTPKEIAEIEAL